MSFTLDLTRFAKRYDADIKVVVRKIAFDAFQRVILRTPVDTGRARANWSVALNAPLLGQTTEATDKSGSAALKAAQEQVTTFNGDGSIFLTNNVPYIGALEYGSSKQAPQGMVRLTVAEIVGFLQRARLADIKKGTGPT